MNFVKLTTVNDSYEATFIKDFLENEGIDCILTNEHISTLMPNLNGMMGSGVQILVRKEEMEQAILLLNNRNKNDIQNCPICNSTDLKLGIKKKHRIIKGISIAFTFILGFPLFPIKQSYYCNACKAEFGK